MREKEVDRQLCRICGQQSYLISTGRIINSYGLFECSSCGTTMVNKKPRAEELEQLYDDFFQSGAYQQHRVEYEKLRSGKSVTSFYRKWLLFRIGRMCTGQDLVEIGIGSGAFGVMATLAGWRYTGYDISNVAVNFARENRLDARVFQGDELPPLTLQSADAVVMWEVIEHVWNVRGYLEKIRGALRPGGVLLLSTPNYLRPGYQRDKWGGLSAPPVHLNFFTDGSLWTALRQCGFGRIEIFKRRFYRPSRIDIPGFISSFRRMVALEEPPTLCAIARAN